MIKKLLAGFAVFAFFAVGSLVFDRDTYTAGRSSGEGYVHHGGERVFDVVPNVYAKKDKKDKTNKGKGGGKDNKGKGKGRDKDRGPSVPGIPMAAAFLIGLGGISGAAYFLKRRKK